MLESLTNIFIGGIKSVIIAIGIAIAILLFAGIYIYSSWAWMIIAKKLKYKDSWLAWIPFAKEAMILEIGGFSWAWIFLILVPILGWIALSVLLIIANWRIFEKRKYPGWFSLSTIIPDVGFVLYLIAIGFVAWKDKK